ncbi:MAG: LPS-assembly protein LptD [Vicinamibacterales bacterium]
MLRLILSLAVLTASLAMPAPASAQQVSVPGFDRLAAYTYEKVGDKHYVFKGSVELEKGDSSIYADSVEYFEDEERVIAIGNVVVTQGQNRIAADRADFNTRTQLGTFRQASGIATVRQGRQAAPIAGGIAVPQMVGQENDVYYFGETVEKLGPKKYKITNGGFSTCVQPTPRWDLTADTIILSIDHYTLLKQALLNVKGVPMLYLPILYYPTTQDDRATGFLIPTYGVSTIRGQAIHNAFFWAINRSQDATFLFDWFSRAGTGAGSEYRYDMGGGNDGRVTAYMLNQKETTYINAGGGTTNQPAGRNFNLNGSMNQALPGRFRARAQVDYFSSVVSNQTFSTNVNDATRNQRRYSGNVYGTVAGTTINGTFDRTEYFTGVSAGSTSSQVMGSSPRITVTRSERPLFSGSSVYFGTVGEFVRLDRQTLANDVIVTNGDRSLARIDVAPTIRYPFKRWPFLTVNSSLSWRETYYTRSLDLRDTSGGTVLDDGVNRQYFTMLAQVVGPVFTRVWNTPNNGYAERFKHTIEPFFNAERTSAIDNYARIVKIEGTDYTYGSTTRYNYGINNRFYAKRKVGATSQAQEILALEVNQTYYSNASASLVDTRFLTSTAATAPNKFSPIAVNLRATPTQTVNGQVRAEVDSRYHKLRQMSANTTLNLRQQVLATVGWSHTFYIKELPGFDNRDSLSHYITAQTTLQTRDRRYGAVYSFNYDIQRSAMLQQRMSGFYNAQCCGIALEYQQYNFAGLPSYIVPTDRRFFLSFSLAGLGNFSPFNGALGGVPR